MKKRLSMILLLAMTTFVVWAQESRFGVQVGFTEPIYRLNSLQHKSKLDSTIMNGFKLGVVYDATLVKGFGTSVGINYTYAGQIGNKKYINQAVSTDWWEQINRSLHALEVFVDWQYKFEIAKHTYVLLYTGPTIQCNLSYVEKKLEHNPLTGEATTEKSHFDKENGDLKRLNVTWGVGAGFEYERYFLRGGYDFGLMNPYRAKDFGEDTHYTRGRLDQWQIKVGVYF